MLTLMQMKWVGLRLQEIYLNNVESARRPDGLGHRNAKALIDEAISGVFDADVSRIGWNLGYACGILVERHDATWADIKALYGDAERWDPATGKVAPPPVVAGATETEIITSADVAEVTADELLGKSS